MAMIVHRCDCGHPDIYHQGESCSFGHCQARAHAFTPEPEIIPTFNNGVELPHLHEPGSTIRTMGLLPLPLCGCELCVLLYEQASEEYEAA